MRKIIKGAKSAFILISPFLRVNNDLKELLGGQDRLRRYPHVASTARNELQPEESEWLQSLTSVKTSFRKNLHAKCYLNEDKALLTSMNLYEFSEARTTMKWDTGITRRRAGRNSIRGDTTKAMRILDKSDEFRVTVARVEPLKSTEEPSEIEGSRTTAQAPEEGFCIRCGDTDPPTRAGRTAERCKSWNRFKNDDYEEKHCHTCGKEHKATMAKPVCLTCYRKHKNWVDSTTK